MNPKLNPMVMELDYKSPIHKGKCWDRDLWDRGSTDDEKKVPPVLNLLLLAVMPDRNKKIDPVLNLLPTMIMASRTSRSDLDSSTSDS